MSNGGSFLEVIRVLQTVAVYMKTFLKYRTFCPTFTGFMTDIPLNYDGHLACLCDIYSVSIGHYVRRYKGKRRTWCSKHRTCPDVRRLFIYTAVGTQIRAVGVRKWSD